MSRKLWVRLESTEEDFNQPTQVPALVNDNVDDFKVAIKTKLQLPNPPQEMTVHLTENADAMDCDDLLPAINRKDTALIVKVKKFKKTGSTTKQVAFKIEAADATQRRFYDGVTKNMALCYMFGRGQNTWIPSIGDVIKAYETGKWDYVKRPMTCEERMHKPESDDLVVPVVNVALPDVFEMEDWIKLKEMTRQNNAAIHNGAIPTLAQTRYLILADDDQFEENSAFFKRIGVRSLLFEKEDDLQIKRDLVLSGSDSSVQASISSP